MKRYAIVIALVVTVWPVDARGDEQPSVAPKPVPATRPEMKAALEALKNRTPRLPLPKADEGGVNNGRMRAHYLPDAWVGASGRSRSGGRLGQDPSSLFDYAFTTSLFWVVSRGNNCHYCLGHQELKLRGAGLDDDTIAALDCDWSAFEPRHQAALVYARKLTLDLQLVNEEDFARLKAKFSDAEIIELTYNIARFNATNRWTDGMGLPQDRRFGEEGSSLDTPTSAQFHKTVSIVAPATRTPRPQLPTVDEVTQAIESCRHRAPRVKLKNNETNAPLWERAMSLIPTSGPAQVVALNTIMTDDHLPLRLKAELALISAIHNRAWYAAGHAVHRLRELGATTEEMAALFDVDAEAASGSTPAYRLAAKLTADPHLITDADIAQVRNGFSDAETAQIVHVICTANLLDRFTESLGLPLEDGVCQ